MCFMSLIKTLSSIARFMLDTVAPPDPSIRDIERLSMTDFRDKLKTATETPRKDGVIGFFPYRIETLRSSLVELKTFKNEKIVRLIAGVARECLMGVLEIKKDSETGCRPLLLPIPMTRKSQRARGWNQCELIVHEISRIDRGETFETRTDVLLKTRETEDQVGKDRSERFENLKSCFAVREGCDIRGRTVIVFDDIVTTGATLGEAKRALLQAGARAVICVAVAY